MNNCKECGRIGDWEQGLCDVCLEEMEAEAAETEEDIGSTVDSKMHQEEEEQTVFFNSAGSHKRIDIEGMCNVLRSVWADGILDDDEIRLLEEKKKDYNIDDELFAVLDAKIRQELGLISPESTSQPVSVKISVSDPIINSEHLSISFKLENLKNERIERATIMINKDELYSLKVLRSPEAVMLNPGEERVVQLRVQGIAVNSHGEQLDITVVTLTKSGVRQAHRCREIVRIPIYKDIEDFRERGKGVNKITIDGKFVDFSVTPEILKKVRHIEISSAHESMVKFRALGGEILDCLEKGRSNIGGIDYQALTLVIDQRSIAQIDASVRRNMPQAPAGRRYYGVWLRVREKKRERFLFISSKNETIYGRKEKELKNYYSRLFVYDKRHKDDENDLLTKEISEKHFTIKFTGDDFCIKDGGKVRASRNGTFLNKEMLAGAEWKVLRSFDEITVTKKRNLRLIAKIYKKYGAQGVTQCSLDSSSQTESKGGGGNSCLKLINQEVIDEDYEYLIMPTQLEIGSASNCEICIQSHTRVVTELNARLMYYNYNYYLMNTDSMENVWVNDELVRLNEVVLLNDRDEIQVGDAYINFKICV